MRHEPFEGTPQTQGDQRQAEAPYRIHYKHPSTGLPAVVGFSQAEALALMEDLRGIFDPEASKGEDEARKSAEEIRGAAQQNADELKKSSEQEVTDLLKAAKRKVAALIERAKKEAKSTKDAAQQEATAITLAAGKEADKKVSGSVTVEARDQPTDQLPAEDREPAEAELLKLITVEEEKASNWLTESAGIDADGIFMNFPDGSRLRINVTDLGDGLFMVGGARKTKDGESPILEEDLDTRAVLKLVNLIAPEMQGDLSSKS